VATPSLDRRIVLGGLLLVLAIAAALLWPAAEPRIDIADAALVASGSALYDEHCAACHGADLEGAPDWQEAFDDGTLPAPPHDASGHTWHHPNALLFAIVKHGGQSQAPDGFTSTMPGFEGILSDVEIAAVLTFIQSRWPADILDDRARNLAPGL
jgi:mono/diheme cytochrome c family protein